MMTNETCYSASAMFGSLKCCRLVMQFHLFAKTSDLQDKHRPGRIVAMYPFNALSKLEVYIYRNTTLKKVVTLKATLCSYGYLLFSTVSRMENLALVPVGISAKVNTNTPLMVLLFCCVPSE